MTNRTTRGVRRAAKGQVILLFALTLLIILAMLSVALDGSFGLVQLRRAQNGADFGSVAATRKLQPMCEDGQLPPDNSLVFNTIQDVMDLNAPTVGANWKAYYLDALSAPIPDPSNPPTFQLQVRNAPGTYPPPNACGVVVAGSPTWRPYLAGIIGTTSLTANVSAAAVNRPKSLTLASIVSLNKVGPHAILGGGVNARFVVSGDMFVNSTNTIWGSNQQGMFYDDVVDAKDQANLYVYGIVHTAKFKVGGLDAWPTDWCYGSLGPTPNVLNNPMRAWQPGYPPPAPDNVNTPSDPQHHCTADPSTFDYNYIDNQWAPIDDPLGGASAMRDPLVDGSVGWCPGWSSLRKFTNIPGQPGGPPVAGQWLPGEYDFTAIITGSNTFNDCGGGYSGMYRFPFGVSIKPGAGQSVVGSNIVFATGSAVGIAGNVPGTFGGAPAKFNPTGPGNGAPCYPLGSQNYKGGAEADSTIPCGGTTQRYGQQLYGVIAKNEGGGVGTTNGTGNNFSLILGGSGAINLKAATYGSYQNVLFFQKRTQPANYGLDAEPGDAATIDLTGLVYNASLTGYGDADSNGQLDPKYRYYWDTGIPFYDGGTLQAGYGTGGNGQQTVSAGSVKVTGICLVDDFNTDGDTNITIVGVPYDFPGTGLGPGLIQ